MLAALSLLNCPGGVDDYYPTSVGSNWNYRMFVLMSSTDGTADTVQTMQMTTLANRKDKLHSGEDAIEMITTTINTIKIPRESTFTVVETNYVRETGNAVLDYDSKDDTEPDTILVLPLAKGKIWHIAEEILAEVMDQEDVTVAAGTYKKTWKIKQRETGTDEEIYIWYANRVGMVRVHSEWSFMGYNFTMHGELTSASIK